MGMLLSQPPVTSVTVQLRDATGSDVLTTAAGPLNLWSSPAAQESGAGI